MKWYAIPAKYDLWFVFVLAGLGWAVIGGLYVYFAESYLVFEEERVSDEPETITVRLAGSQRRRKGEKVFVCPYVDEVTETLSAQTDERTSHLALAFPAGLPSPQNSELAVNGNTFQLTGYRFENHRKNILTGEVQNPPTSFPRRFDVIAWEVVAPYAVMGSEDGSGESAILEDQTSPVRHQMEKGDTSSGQFEFPENLPCPVRRSLWRGITVYSRSDSDE